jgi:hypothetical protein
MFHDMRNGTLSGTTHQDALAAIRRRLPPGWVAEERLTGLRARSRRGARVGGDAAGPRLRLTGPDGRAVDLALDVRMAVLPRDVPALLAAYDRPVLVVAPHLGGRARQLLADGGASYADATGNIRVVTSVPAIFLEGVGADRDPTPAARALHSLRGAAAGRVVRALVELPLPLGVRALAAAADTPLGTVSRVVTFLEAEALITRDATKRIVAVDAPALLERWSADYALTGSNALRAFLEPRGLASLWPKLGRLPRYAATGSTAGPGVAPARIAMLYVDEPDAAAQQLGLVAADAGANVWLLQPFDDVVFTRTRQRSVPGAAGPVDVVVVAEAQAVVDLATAPGRGPEEAAVLRERMRAAHDGS